MVAVGEGSRMLVAGTSEHNPYITFKYIMGTQLLWRVISFVVNCWIVRHLTQKEYVFYAAKSPLLVTFILSLSREGFRRQCLCGNVQCNGATLEENAAGLLRVAWITFPIGIGVTMVTCILWSPNLNFSHPYTLAIWIHGFACILELLAEPLYILSQNLLLLKLRLVVESAATILRGMTTFTLIVRGANMEKHIIFALSQVAYGACVFVGYWYFFLTFRIIKCSDLLPFRPWIMTEKDKHLRDLCARVSFLSFGKLLLQEGAKKLAVFFGTTYDQDVYILVDGLGSLVVRLVFLPFEESYFATFAKLASGKSTNKDMMLGNALVDALKLVLLIGLVIVAFGPNYSYILIRLLYGKNRSDGEAPVALSYYCFYVLTLAINGTSEAFLHAVVNAGQLKMSMVLCVISVVLNVLLIQVAGVVGLIAANSLNMMLRIICSAVYIRRYFQGSFSFQRCLPSGWTVLLVSGAITFISKAIFLDRNKFCQTMLIHLVVGVVCFAISAAVIYHREKQFIQNIFWTRKHVD